VIEVPELQQEVKKFIKGGTNTPYEEILEFIRADYRAQETSEGMRDSVKPSAIPSALRRGKSTSGHDEKPLATNSHVVKFSPNQGGLIPSHIFVQVPNWFQRMIIPVDDRSSDNKTWLENFKLHIGDSQYNTPRNDNNQRGGLSQPERL